EGAGTATYPARGAGGFNSPTRVPAITTLHPDLPPILFVSRFRPPASRVPVSPFRVMRFRVTASGRGTGGAGGGEVDVAGAEGGFALHGVALDGGGEGEADLALADADGGAEADLAAGDGAFRNRSAAHRRGGRARERFAGLGEFEGDEGLPLRGI